MIVTSSSSALILTYPTVGVISSPSFFPISLDGPSWNTVQRRNDKKDFQKLPQLNFWSCNYIVISLNRWDGNRSNKTSFTD